MLTDITSKTQHESTVIKKTVSQLREGMGSQKAKIEKPFNLFSSPSSLIKKEDLRNKDFTYTFLFPL